VKACAALSHPNVVRLFDSGAESGTLFMASEYVDGGTLRELLHRAGAMPSSLVAPILSQAIAGLGAAHQQRIVHRDLKPANILLTADGVVKVGDFGVAKSSTDNTITQSGMLFGTPSYMSPEQAFGKDLDGRSDLFSMATLAYELLTGRNPFHHENMSSSLLMVSKVQARPIFELCPQIPAALDDVISRLMQRQPEDRFADAEMVVQALQPLCDAIYARYGNVVADAVRDPEATVARLRQDQANQEVRRAQVALVADPPETSAAAFHFFKARGLDPSNGIAEQELERLRSEHGFRYDLQGDPAIDEIAAALEEKKRSPALLRRGAELYLKKNNLLGGAVWLRRYLRVQPTDKHMLLKLHAIVGADPLSPFSEIGAAAPLELASRTPTTPAPAPAPASADAEQVALPSWDATFKEREPAAPESSNGGSNKRLIIFAAATVVVAVLVGVAISTVRASSREDAQAVQAGAVQSAPAIPAPSAAALRQQRALLKQGRDLAEDGQLAAAATKLGDAFAAEPGSDLAADVLIDRGRVYFNLRRMDAARADFEKAARLVDADDPRRGIAERLLSGMP